MENAQKILLIGSGGREHALAWKMAQSPLCESLYIAPGNSGTAKHGINLPIDIEDFGGIAEIVRKKGVTLVVVGPEAPLVGGLVDYLTEIFPKLMVIGPTKSGAQLEGSKSFAKEFMQAEGIPTARYRKFGTSELDSAVAYLQDHMLPVVIKADGLAAGKGVIICESVESAITEIEEMLSGKFGDASSTIVIEEFLQGREFSVFTLTDGHNYVLLPVARDYKRIGEGDTGPNTGGMGSVSPVAYVDRALMEKVENTIIRPTVRGIAKRGISYKGFVFFGLIEVGGNPYVIEYNCRMGDPETQVVLPRIESDLVWLMIRTANEQLAGCDIEISPYHAMAVILASGGYPGKYEKGKPMDGFDDEGGGTLVFHAGMARDNTGRLITNGGRVAAICTIEPSLDTSLSRTYQRIKKLNFEGMYYRSDIGRDLLH